VRGLIAQAGAVELTDELELDAPRADEVRVRVERCGLCQTDLHLMDGTLEFPLPVVCGHEAAGIVEEVGVDVDRAVLGTRVVVTSRPPCRRCWWCLHGSPQLCADSLAWATGRRPDGTSPLRWRGAEVSLGVGVGAFAEQLIAPAAALVPVGDDVPAELAAVMGCAVLTGVGAVFNTAKVQPGQTVLIVGLGGVGMSAVLAARTAGAGLVIGADTRADRRAASGADVVIDPTVDDVVQLAYDATDGRGVDVAIDAVGDVERSTTTAFLAVRPGGRLVVAGVPATGAEIRLPGGALVSDERHVSGCFIGSADPQRDIPAYLELWRRGRLDLSALVTDVRPLDDLPKLIHGGDTPDGIRTVIDLENRHG
jgi:Zn-dependent alcohol dehydrogenase